MLIHCGPQRLPFVMPENQRVSPEWLIYGVRKAQLPNWIYVDGSYIRLLTDEQLFLACEIVAASHNAYVDPRSESNYQLQREVEEIEEETRARLEAPTDDEGSDGMDERDRPPTPSEDMVYDKVLYM